MLTPIAIGLRLFGAPDLAIFLTSAAAIVPLAGLIGRATEQLALHTGPRIGGLVNATFGNVTELIIAVFLILDDRIEMVKASLTGSILGNLLLVLGLSLFVGGVKHDRQSFNARSASVHATSLALAVTGLLMPALFSLGTHATFAQREVVSGVVAGVLILMYIAALVFTLVTHEHLFRTPQEDETPAWSRRKAVVVLLITTGFVALMSEFLVSSLEPALETLGLSELFVGLILIPVIGNAAEHSSAVMFALRNKVDVTLEIAIGSSTQIALFVAPVLVFISLAVGHPMDFVFSTFEVAAVGLSALLMTLISLDGESNWLEGAQLVGLRRPLSALRPVALSVERDQHHEDRGQSDRGHLERAEDEVHRVAHRQADEHERRGNEQRDLRRGSDRDLEGHVDLVPQREQHRRGVLRRVPDHRDQDQADEQLREPEVASAGSTSSRGAQTRAPPGRWRRAGPRRAFRVTTKVSPPPTASEEVLVRDEGEHQRRE